MNLDLVSYSLELATAILAVVFLVSGVTKLTNAGRFVEIVQSYRILPGRVSRAFALVLIPTELAAAAVLLVPQLHRIGLLLALALLSIFLVAALLNLARGNDVACGCFGDPDERVGWATVGRQLALIAVGGWALVGPVVGATAAPVDEDGWASIGSRLVIVASAAVLVALGSWLARAHEVRTLFRHPRLPQEAVE